MFYDQFHFKTQQMIALRSIYFRIDLGEFGRGAWVNEFWLGVQRLEF